MDFLAAAQAAQSSGSSDNATLLTIISAGTGGLVAIIVALINSRKSDSDRPIIIISRDTDEAEETARQVREFYNQPQKNQKKFRIGRKAKEEMKVSQPTEEDSSDRN